MCVQMLKSRYLKLALENYPVEIRKPYITFVKLFWGCGVAPKFTCHKKRCLQIVEMF